MKELIISINKEITRQYKEPHGFRYDNLDLLLFKADKTQNVHKKAAILMFGIAKDHTFLEANKRTAFITSFILMSVRGYKCISSTDTNERFILNVAKGDRNLKQIEDWLRRNYRKKR